MCGIVGIASTEVVVERRWLVRACDAMMHRGPDDAGEWWSKDHRVGFGHRRLAIIDLSQGGHQPMTDEDGSLAITFNGEIYNFKELRSELSGRGFRFRSQSDTEVILKAYRCWGRSCVTRFNGMFAFAIYDRVANLVFLARDRAGEKPMFYTVNRGTLRFASELKGLLSCPEIDRTVNTAALDCYLSEGFVPGGLCMLRGVQKLPPAHFLEYSLSDAKAVMERYWNIPKLTYSDSASDQLLANELEILLGDAVSRQMISDVPVGVLLSGGVDSSLVTALAAKQTRKIKTFTVRFPNYSDYDETNHARLIASHFGTEHIELVAEEADTELLPRIARQIDEPMADSSSVPTLLVSQLIRKHCTVALGGDGGDELFGGYPHYSRLLWMKSRFRYLPHWLRSTVGVLGRSALPLGFKGRNWLESLCGNFDTEVPLPTSLFDFESRNQLVGKIEEVGISENLRSARMPLDSDLVRRATIFDLENYLVDDILVKVDRASMLSSLEVRAPFLDRHVLEFAFGRVPTHLKATIAERKIILQMLCKKLLPVSFVSNRKQGFSIPLGSWLCSGAWYKYFAEVLLDHDQYLFDRAMITEMLEGQKRGLRNEERLYALVLFELWRKEYKVSVL